MRYKYYVVYSDFHNMGNGLGTMIHERNDKLNSIEKITRLQDAILEGTLALNPNVTQVIITNFILIDESEEVQGNESV
jgi:hypothetical protein